MESPPPIGPGEMIPAFVAKISANASPIIRFFIGKPPQKVLIALK